MHTDEILDNEFSENFQKYLFEKEGMIWEGVPCSWHKDNTVGMLKFIVEQAAESFTIIRISTWSLFPVFAVFFHASLPIIILLTIVALMATIGPLILRYIRKRCTKYAFTRNRVFFQLWRWGKKSTHYIDLADVAKITYEEYTDKSGIIHFLPIKPFDFRTYDFVTGEMRFYPTFEMVPNVIELYTKLEALRQERIKF